MKWPTTEKFYNGFRGLTILSSMALMLDQLFIRWHPEGDIGIVSLAGFLPENIMTSHVFFQVVTVTSMLCAALWLWRVLPKLTSVITILLFILSTSLYLQNEPFGDHRQSVFCLLLMCLAAREYRLLQYYFFQVAGSIVVSFYFLAGWEKIFYSGLSWVNGTGLQVFVHFTGSGKSILRDLILKNVDLARFFQAGILILECGSFFLFGPRALRRLWILGLIGFHIGIEEIFGYRYFLHLLVVLYLFALPELMERKNDQIA